MDSQSPKLSLHLSPPWLHAGERIIEPDKPSHLPNYLARLQHELTKIESFKRELPLSFLLLSDAVGRLKKEGEEVAMANCDLDESRLENIGAVDGDKKAWMSSAQLWSSDDHTSFQKPREREEDGHTCKYFETTGVLSSFNEGSGISPARKGLVLTGPGLSLQVKPEPVTGLMSATGVGGGARFTPVPVLADKIKLSPPPVSSELRGPKKERRCWSPELHRRFVNALEKLGGSQVATPKQIRELMQVNDLTNDEVKSHLQKYRLHRKLPSLTTSLSKYKLFVSPMKTEKQAIRVPHRDPCTW